MPAVNADANFKGADLTGASIESVDFENADLTDAILSEAQVGYFFLHLLALFSTCSSKSSRRICSIDPNGEAAGCVECETLSHPLLRLSGLQEQVSSKGILVEYIVSQ